MNKLKIFILLMTVVLVQSCSENDFQQKKNLDADALKTVLNKDEKFSKLLTSTLTSFSKLAFNSEKEVSYLPVRLLLFLN